MVRQNRAVPSLSPEVSAANKAKKQYWKIFITVQNDGQAIARNLLTPLKNLSKITWKHALGEKWNAMRLQFTTINPVELVHHAYYP